MGSKSGGGAGIGRAVAETVEPGETPGAEAVQLELLGSLLGLPAAKASGPMADTAGRGPGRPPGARNKRTVAWTEYLTKRYRHPLETLAIIQGMDTADLANRLGVKPAEALDMQTRAAVGMLPYVAQRQALAVDVTNRKLFYLNIGGAGDDIPVSDEFGSFVENQIVSFLAAEAVEGQSDDQQSDGGGK